MEVVRVRVRKSAAIVAEFDVRAHDPEELRDRLHAACIAAGALGHASATIEDIRGRTVELPTKPDGIDISRPTTHATG